MKEKTKSIYKKFNKNMVIKQQFSPLDEEYNGAFLNFALYCTDFTKKNYTDFDYHINFNRPNEETKQELENVQQYIDNYENAEDLHHVEIRSNGPNLTEIEQKDFIFQIVNAIHFFNKEGLYVLSAGLLLNLDNVNYTISMIVDVDNIEKLNIVLGAI